MRGWKEPNKIKTNREIVYQFNKDSGVKDLPLTYKKCFSNWVGSIHNYTKHNKLAVMNLLPYRTIALFMSKEGHSKKI